VCRTVELSRFARDHLGLQTEEEAADKDKCLFVSEDCFCSSCYQGPTKLSSGLPTAMSQHGAPHGYGLRMCAQDAPRHGAGRSWVRFGVSLYKEFTLRRSKVEEWHVAYHGTKVRTRHCALFLTRAAVGSDRVNPGRRSAQTG
jgi:hypothetical protein